MSSAAIVLSGGSSLRLGRDKSAELVGGRSLLRRVTDALIDVDQVVVVGRADGAGRADIVLSEDPRGSGPVAAVRAGLAAVESDVVFLIAADLPFLTAPTLAELAASLRGARAGTAAVATDDAGRMQYLLAAWPAPTLRVATGGVSAAGSRLGEIYHNVPVEPVAVTGWPPPWWDCDTEAELACARRWADEAGVSE